MKSRIVALLCLLLAAVTGATEAFTLDEAAAYIQRDPQGAAEDIVKLDAIERAMPVVVVPVAAVIVAGRGVTVAWQGPIDITIAGSLHYRLTLQPVTAQDMLPPVDPWWVVPAWTAGGMAAGALLTLLAMAVASALK